MITHCYLLEPRGFVMVISGYKVIVHTPAGKIEVPAAEPQHADWIEEFIRISLIKQSDPSFRVPKDWEDMVTDGRLITFNTMTIVTAHISAFETVGIVEH